MKVGDNYVHKFTNIDKILYSEDRDYSKRLRRIHSYQPCLKTVLHYLKRY